MKKTFRSLSSLLSSTVCAFLLLCLCSFGVNAQDAIPTDSTAKKDTVVEKQKQPKAKDVSTEEAFARKSAFRSAVIPGWGQIHNESWHWLKIPVIYTLIGGSAYITRYNHQKYKCYEKAYSLASKGLYGECDGFTRTSTLKRGMDDFHKQRDMFVLITIGAYALNVLDAYVWGHLTHFDNSNDLSMRVYPSFHNIAGYNQSALTLSLQF